MGVAKSQIRKKTNSQYTTDESTCNPDMLKEINSVGPGFMVQFESKLQEGVRLSRYVGGYGWLGGRTDLGRCQSRRGAQTNDRQPNGWAEFVRTLKMACI
jgi:hypothetical protein